MESGGWAWATMGIEGVYDNVGWQKLPKTLHVFLRQWENKKKRQDD
jgi:hypothetical protein